MYIKRILCVLIPGVTVPVSDTRIPVSFVSRVPVSGDLACTLQLFFRCPKPPLPPKGNIKVVIREDIYCEFMTHLDSPSTTSWP